MIFATHRVEEISQTFTHGLLIDKGRVVASGPKRSVLTSKNRKHSGTI
jgi:iron complex transport system ATP-binding protein